MSSRTSEHKSTTYAKFARRAFRVSGMILAYVVLSFKAVLVDSIALQALDGKHRQAYPASSPLCPTKPQSTKFMAPSVPVRGAASSVSSRNFGGTDLRRNPMLGTPCRARFVGLGQLPLRRNGRGQNFTHFHVLYVFQVHPGRSKHVFSNSATCARRPLQFDAHFSGIFRATRRAPGAFFPGCMLLWVWTRFVPSANESGGRLGAPCRVGQLSPRVEHFGRFPERPPKCRSGMRFATRQSAAGAAG